MAVPTVGLPITCDKRERIRLSVGAVYDRTFFEMCALIERTYSRNPPVQDNRNRLIPFARERLEDQEPLAVRVDIEAPLQKSRSKT